ncbi:hypothetical protein [Geomonas sp.]|uniref:hypothetical protein n=1 Tax=Geomonas sp. TaxID=2651584 RepID=UPI002B480F05|nr:hypothetical protein [Geomonas sp.]HJV33787.1 hypothetical protein [Geomonas sp.]
MRKLLVLFVVWQGCLLCQGCSNRAWYDMLREQQRQLCNQEKSLRATQQCLERVNGVSYDEYERLRKESLNAEQGRN